MVVIVETWIWGQAHCFLHHADVVPGTVFGYPWLVNVLAPEWYDRKLA